MGFKLEQHITAPTALDKEAGLQILLKKEITFFGAFFNNKEKENFYSELGILLKAGVQLREALDIISNNQKKDKLKSFFSGILWDLDQGDGLSEIMAARKEFTQYEHHSVGIGEQSGNLPKIINELGGFFSRKNEQRRILMNAMTYPVIILCTAVLVMVFMLRMVVPMFETIFKQNRMDLPAITTYILGVSNFLGDYGLYLLFLIPVFLLSWKLLLKKEKIQKHKDNLILKIPFLGDFVKTVYLAQFTHAVALLTSSKVPILNSIQMVGKMISFYPLREALFEMEHKIVKGMSLHESIKENKIFDHKMASLVKVAEETNQTEYIFDKLNQQYATEVQQKSKLLSTLMEPLIIVVIGVFVGVILISMYLPIFKLSSIVG